jgi:putative endonuclease
MNYCVYVLFSQPFDKIYIGFTSNLEARILSHNNKATKGWTIKFRPWTLVHQEFFESKTDALRREKQLKSANGRMFIRNTILKNHLLS